MDGDLSGRSKPWDGEQFSSPFSLKQCQCCRQASISKGQFCDFFLCGYVVNLYSRVEHPLLRQMVSLEGVLGTEPALPSLHPCLSLSLFPLLTLLTAFLSALPRPAPLLDPEFCSSVLGCLLLYPLPPEHSSSTHLHPPGLSWWSSGEDSSTSTAGGFGTGPTCLRVSPREKKRYAPTSFSIVPRQQERKAGILDLQPTHI